MFLSREAGAEGVIINIISLYNIFTRIIPKSYGAFKFAFYFSRTIIL